MDRQQVIDEAVRRLVKYFQPERIYLYGSTARGEDRPDSDLDFLVVVPDDTPSRRFWEVYKELAGLDCGRRQAVSDPRFSGPERLADVVTGYRAARRKGGLQSPLRSSLRKRGRGLNMLVKTSARRGPCQPLRPWWTK